jgi:hypothetical protein
MPTINDDFNRSNSDPISGNWTTCNGFGDMQIDTNHAMGADSGTDNFAYWDADEFDPDHWIVYDVNSAGWQQCCVRLNIADSDNFYCFYIAAWTSCYFYRVVNGSWQQIGSEFNPSGGDDTTIKFDVNGNDLTVYFDDVEKGSESDSTFPSNTGVGIGHYGNSTSYWIDNFEASDGLTGLTELDPDSGGLAFGEESPTGQDPSSWALWSDGAGGSPTIVGDADWGKLRLEVDAEGRSEVYDFTNSQSRTLTLTLNDYGTGSGTVTVQIRGHDSTVFAQDDVSPSWETYSSPVAKTWRYIQFRIVE